MVTVPVELAGHLVGAGQPCFVIAEAGVNHNGDVNLAHQLIDVAVAAGASAVKFQTFRADRLVTATAPKATYQIQATGAQESQFEMLRRLELSPEGYQELMDYCVGRGILFLSTPFDEDSADLLDRLGIAAFKIPSGELTNLPFIVHIARKGKPIIMSTGMATLGEVESAVQAIHSTGNQDLILLHCVSNYPADPVDVNLRAMKTMETAFGTPVGYSDHTLGDTVALAAVALGACLIEKHFTLDCTLPGPDHRASVEPAGLTELVAKIRTVEAALGQGRKAPAASEANTAAVARKSLVLACDVLAGNIVTEQMIVAKRPGTGLPPALLPFVIGRTLRQDSTAGTIITLEMLT